MEDLNKDTSERARERGLMKSKSYGSKGCPERRPLQHKYQGLLRTLGSTGARKERSQKRRKGASRNGGGTRIGGARIGSRG